MAAARGWEVTRHVLLVQGSFKDSVELWAL